MVPIALTVTPTDRVRAYGQSQGLNNEAADARWRRLKIKIEKSLSARSASAEHGKGGPGLGAQLELTANELSMLTEVMVPIAFESSRGALLQKYADENGINKAAADQRWVRLKKKFKDHATGTKTPATPRKRKQTAVVDEPQHDEDDDNAKHETDGNDDDSGDDADSGTKALAKKKKAKIAPPTPRKTPAKRSRKKQQAQVQAQAHVPDSPSPMVQSFDDSDGALAGYSDLIQLGNASPAGSDCAILATDPSNAKSGDTTEQEDAVQQAPSTPTMTPSKTKNKNKTKADGRAGAIEPLTPCSPVQIR